MSQVIRMKKDGVELLPLAIGSGGEKFEYEVVADTTDVDFDASDIRCDNGAGNVQSALNSIRSSISSMSSYAKLVYTYSESVSLNAGAENGKTITFDTPLSSSNYFVVFETENIRFSNMAYQKTVNGFTWYRGNLTSGNGSGTVHIYVLLVEE